MTHNPAASICVHVTVHPQGPAGIPVQVDGVEATGDVTVLLNLTAVQRVWKTRTNWEPSRRTALLEERQGRRGVGLVPYFKVSFPGGSEVKAPACNAGDLGLIPGSGKIPWRRKWQPSPVFLPGESHGQRSLVGYSPQGHKESDMTERLHFHFV